MSHLCHDVASLGDVNRVAVTDLMSFLEETARLQQRLIELPIHLTKRRIEYEDIRAEGIERRATAARRNANNRLAPTATIANAGRKG